MIERLKSARRCGVPLVAIATSDQRAVLSTIVESINSGCPIIKYDCVTGLSEANKYGRKEIINVVGENDPSLFTDPVTVLQAVCERTSENTITVLIGADRYISDVRTQQAIANCRDPFKTNSRTLIMLSSGILTLPADLSDDTLQIDDQPPNDSQREEITKAVFQDAGLEEPSKELLKVVIDATRSQSAYNVEQSVALSLSKNGLNQEVLWDRWRQSINATPGLTVDRSGTTIDDIGGLINFKSFCRKIMSGKNPPSAIIRIEEIEKAMGGSGYGGGPGDTSNVTQSLLQYLLTWMQEENATGLIAVGPAGGGKSLSSVAMGSVGNVPTITLDFGAIKNSLVGDSEKNMRRALATIKALAGSKTFWIGTCNSLFSLPPELRRRFQYGIWYFDLLSKDEREAVWKIWLRKYPGVPDVRPDDDGWTGAEIRTAVQTAYNLDCTPKEAANWIVPVSRMAAETIEGLRKQAHNRYLSANYPGVYQYITKKETTTKTRKLSLE